MTVEVFGEESAQEALKIPGRRLPVMNPEEVAAYLKNGTLPSPLADAIGRRMSGKDADASRRLGDFRKVPDFTRVVKARSGREPGGSPEDVESNVAEGDKSLTMALPAKLPPAPPIFL